MSDRERRLARLEETAGATEGVCLCMAYGGAPLSGAITAAGDPTPPSERCPTCGGRIRSLAVLEEVVNAHA